MSIHRALHIKSTATEGARRATGVAVLIDSFNAFGTVSDLSVCHVTVFGAVGLLHLSLLKHIPGLLPEGPESVR